MLNVEDQGRSESTGEGEVKRWTEERKGWMKGDSDGLKVKIRRRKT